jgi:hypothetical protein
MAVKVLTHTNPYACSDRMQCAECTAGIRIYKEIMAIHHHSHPHPLNNSPARVHRN